MKERGIYYFSPLLSSINIFICLWNRGVFIVFPLLFMLSLLCFRIVIWIAPLWRSRGSPVEYQKGYVLAHLLLWTVGLVRDTVAMAEGLLGLLTEQSSTSHPHASGVKGDAGQWLFTSHVLHCPGAESGRYTEASPTKRMPSRETSTCSPGFHFIMIKPGNYIYRLSLFIINLSFIILSFIVFFLKNIRRI